LASGTPHDTRPPLGICTLAIGFGVAVDVLGAAGVELAGALVEPDAVDEPGVLGPDERVFRCRDGDGAGLLVAAAEEDLPAAAWNALASAVEANAAHEPATGEVMDVSESGFEPELTRTNLI
jgi:hypothetical protein